MHIKAVIFDRDHTLLRFDPAVVAALEARIAAAAPALPPGAVAAYWGSWQGQWPRSVGEEPAFWVAFWRDLAAHHQLSASSTTALHEIGAFYHTCFTAFPDARDCLATLRSRGVRLAILTNFELPSIDLTLRNAGLDPEWFSVLLSSVSIGFPKPNPRAYLAVTAALNLAPEECAFVDDLEVNVQAARALGILAWQLDRGDNATTSIAPRIRDLHELTSLLTGRSYSE